MERPSDPPSQRIMAATAVLHVLAGDLELVPEFAGTEDTVSMLRTLATRGVKPVRFEACRLV